jgi:hypothetical protein
MQTEPATVDKAALQEAAEAQRRKVRKMPLTKLIAETERLYERAFRAFKLAKATRRFQEWLDHEPSQRKEALLDVTRNELSARCYGACADLMELLRIGLANGDAEVLEEAAGRYREMPSVMQRCLWAQWFQDEPEYEGAEETFILDAEPYLDVAIRLRHEAKEYNR